MMRMVGRALLFLSASVSLLGAAHISARGANVKQKADITLEQVIAGSFADGSDDEPGTWAPDGKGYLAIEDSSHGSGQEIDEIDVRSGKRTVIVPARMLIEPKTRRPIDIQEFSLSKDSRYLLVFTNSARVWRENTRGDYWLLDTRNGHPHKVGGSYPKSSLMFAKISPDGSRVGFVHENNLYLQDTATGKVTALTSDGSKTLINGTFDWVYEEELDLRDGWKWSPDGKSIAYWQLDTHQEPLFTLIDDTDSLYPTLKQFPYPKAGQRNATARIGVVSANGGKTAWIGEPATSESGYLARMEWSPNSRGVLIQRLNRLQNEDRYTLTDVRSGVEKTVFVDRDAAWVDTWGQNDTAKTGVRWSDDGRSFLILSESDGWRHLYSIAIDGGGARLLTNGKFDVESVVGFDKAHRAVYFIASPTNATQRYLYETRSDGSPKVERITPSDESAYAGTNSYSISPGGDVALHTLSTLTSPPVRDVVSLPDHTRLRQIGDGSQALREMDRLNLGQTSFVKLKADDGEEMDGFVILPPHFDSSKKYPLFFEVYGEPAALTAQDLWSSESFFFDQFLAEKGYIVASVDNRGTPSLKGREWRKSIYKKIGIVASADQAAAVRQLLERSYIDASRVGIWGWSGGGSMTLNMLFRYPDLYSLGMAVAPVPDVRLYDSIYQERYLGLPRENPEVYRDCSPITFATQLKGNLLIVHGSGDDNVHYQGTERLVNELVADDKPFELMVYPNRSHGIYEGEGTTQHLYELLVRFLTTHMPPGGR
jgi:dipeptidyl-peptidase-4